MKGSVGFKILPTFSVILWQVAADEPPNLFVVYADYPLPRNSGFMLSESQGREPSTYGPRVEIESEIVADTAGNVARCYHFFAFHSNLNEVIFFHLYLNPF